MPSTLADSGHSDSVLATVVRYFGGIKLGAGGLVRRSIAAAGATLLEVRHGTVVRLQWHMPESDAPTCRASLENGARGAIGWL